MSVTPGAITPLTDTVHYFIATKVKACWSMTFSLYPTLYESVDVLLEMSNMLPAVQVHLIEPAF